LVRSCRTVSGHLRPFENHHLRSLEIHHLDFIVTTELYSCEPDFCHTCTRLLSHLYQTYVTPVPDFCHTCTRLFVTPVSHCVNLYYIQTVLQAATRIVSLVDGIRIEFFIQEQCFGGLVHLTCPRLYPPIGPFPQNSIRERITFSDPRDLSLHS